MQIKDDIEDEPKIDAPPIRNDVEVEPRINSPEPPFPNVLPAEEGQLRPAQISPSFEISMGIYAKRRLRALIPRDHPLWKLYDLGCENTSYYHLKGPVGSDEDTDDSEDEDMKFRGRGNIGDVECPLK